MIVAAVVLSGCGNGGKASSGAVGASRVPPKTTSVTASPSKPAVTWKQVHAKFRSARNFTFEGSSRLEVPGLLVTQPMDGVVDRTADASFVRTAVTSSNPKFALPGETKVTSVDDGVWMQMSVWKPPNRGKWLDLGGQGVPAVGQQTLVQAALDAFSPSGTTAVRFQFEGTAPLKDTVQLLGIRNLPKGVKVDGDVDMTVTVSDDAAVTHIRLEGVSLKKSSLASEYAEYVFGSSFDAEINLAPTNGSVKAPAKALVITELSKTG